MTDPLDWDALVREAKRRRAAENLTQQAHAALAGVSRDTIRSFDQGGRSLTLEKALAILNVVGLVARAGMGTTAEEQRHAAFVRRCWDRWEALIAHRPANDPARLPHGRVAYSYYLDGRLFDADAHEALAAMEKAQSLMRALSRTRSVSGWPPFHIFEKASLRPDITEGELECWLGKDPEDRVFYDAPHLDYWRVSAEGDFFLLRGYQEDGADSQEPGTFLDIGLPVWRLADVLEHALELTGALPAKLDRITFQTEWQGLKGRHLVNWVRPTATMRGGRAYRSPVDTVRGTVSVQASEGADALREAVLALSAPLYAAFAVSDPEQLVAEELDRRHLKMQGG